MEVAAAAGMGVRQAAVQARHERKQEKVQTAGLSQERAKGAPIGAKVQVCHCL